MKRYKRGTKKGYKVPYVLTPKQDEILRLLTITGMTPRMIAKHYNTTVWAVYKIIKKLKEKGVLEGGTIRGYKKQTPPPLNITSSRYFRLHGLHLKMKALSLSERYKKRIKKMNIIEIGGYKTTFYPSGKIEINEPVGHSFNGETTDIALNRAMEQFNRIIKKIENDWLITIIKDRKCNIEIANGHLAEVENEIAKYSVENIYEKITIYGSDGRAWAKIDMSTKEPEFETISPSTFKPDMDVVQTYMNDWRENKPPTNSELMNIVAKQSAIIEQQLQMLSNVQIIANQFEINMKKHLELIDIFSKESEKRQRDWERLLRRLEK